ncbi:hypothetical protein bpr_II325 (plasmid) [Butyrivibrio proteoclasticus B316]|uniref:Uncharacterized protein n=2 Tax=Butyrivibrio proteoclasticus TaxID=43305 RepID=E0S4D0_BUTPB|nr:hypothetical protein bpr_II325 [Butyrivibrio proteoclasticus B316]
MEIPWHTQLMKLQQTIEADKDISDDVKEKLYDVIEKELKDKSREDIYADKGYDDLVRLIGKSKLSKADKEHVQDIIKECKYQMHDPYAMYLNRSEYIAMVKLLNESNMMSQVVPMQLISGNYMLLYNAGIAEKMNELESATKLQVGKYLRPEVIDLQAYAKKTEGQIFKFTGLTSELAEKAIMESTKSRSFSFAKEKCDDGTYNLYCYGGNNAADNEKFYKEAVQTIALAAYSMTGKTADVERARTRHSDTEQNKINRVLDCIQNDVPDQEDSGYIFSIHEYTDSQNRRWIQTNDYVQFGPTEYTAHYNGTEESQYASRSGDYLRDLRIAIQSGTGQKVYISDNRMDELKDAAKDVYRYIEGLPAENRLDKIVAVQKDIAALKDEIDKEDIPTIKLAKQKELAMKSVAYEALSYNMKQPVTPQSCLDRQIAAELAKAQFRGYATKSLTPDDIKAAGLANKALIECLRDSNNSRISNLDYKTPSRDDIISVMANADYKAFLTKEFDRAMPDSQKGDNGFTIADVQSERQILEQTFKSRCTEAMEELGSINIVIEHAPSRLFEEKGRDNTKNLYTIMREKEDMFLNRHKDDKTPDKSSKSSETHKKDIGLDMSK